MTPAEQLTILKNIINIPTENQNEAAIADYLTTLFAPYEQATIERYTYAPGRDNIVITIGSGHPVLVLSGHMDTVNAGDRTAWTSDPFDATIRDGNLYGRGGVRYEGWARGARGNCIRNLRIRYDLPRHD